MPRTNPTSRRLAALQHARQVQLMRHVDAGATLVDRAVGSVWQRLLDVIRTTHGIAYDYRRALAVLRQLPAVIAGTLATRLDLVYRKAHRGAGLSVVEAVPKRLTEARLLEDETFGDDHLDRLLVGRVPKKKLPPPPQVKLPTGHVVDFIQHHSQAPDEVNVMVDVNKLNAAWSKEEDEYIPPGGGGAEIGGRIANFIKWLGNGKPVEASRVGLSVTGGITFTDGRHRFSALRDLGAALVAVTVPREQEGAFTTLFGAEPVDAPEDPRDLFAALVLPAPSEESIWRALAPLVRMADWTPIGEAQRKLPHELAAEIAGGMSQGLTQQQIAKQVLPFLDGSRVRARRAARTFGMHIAHSAQMEAWSGIDHMIMGYTVHGTMDANIRPAHRARSGNTYWKRPGPGQIGIESMPRPPREADGRLAFN